MRSIFPLVGLLAGASFSLQAATFVVNDADDAPDFDPGDGTCDVTLNEPAACTLRAAIMEANATQAADTVEFSIDLVTIDVVGTPLPTITEPLSIDATTAPSYNAAAINTLDAPPSVYIDGSALTGPTLQEADGLRSDNTYDVVIQGLGIINFPDDGIELFGAGPALVDSNWIGVNRNGSAAGNGSMGVFLNFISGATVGRDAGNLPEITRGNVISNNGEHGVYSFVGDSVRIVDNFIGVDPVGNAAFGNGGDGIRVDGSTRLIGNQIENNTGAGIYTEYGANEIYGNYVAFNQNGGIRLNGFANYLGFETKDQGNAVIENIGPGVTMGNERSALNNVVRFLRSEANTGPGLWIIAGNSNWIRNSSFGGNGDDAMRIDGRVTTVTDSEFGLINGVPLGNAGSGVVLASEGNSIEGNVIGSVTEYGVDVVTGQYNTVGGNYIGVRQTGTDIGVGNAGVRVRAGATDTRVRDNRIGYNLTGVVLAGSGTEVCGNWIGVSESDANIGNNMEGILIQGDNNRIGDPSSDCEGNEISFNTASGIQISGNSNTIRHNVVGGGAGPKQGNGDAGVFIASGAHLNVLESNTIGHNGNDGIGLASDAGTGNRLEGNEFRRNGDLSIDLEDDGETPNDAGDGDSGANNLQNYPEITQVSSDDGQLQVTYQVDSELPNSAYPLTVEFYVEGTFGFSIKPIGRDTYDQTPNTPKTVLINTPESSALIRALVIDDSGNTSELSPAQPYIIDAIFTDLFEAQP